MNELATVPTSIRQRLEQVQDLIAQNRPDEAANALRSAELELAKSHPELFVLLLAVRQGYNGIRFSNSEHRTGVEKIKREFFGKSMGEELVPFSSSVVVTKTVEFF